LTHPVVSDADFAIWQRYGVRAWPTLILIDPNGYVVGSVAGEGHGPVLDQTIAALIDEHRAAGALREGPGPAAPHEDGARGTLAFPGKVAADPATGRIAIADSGHHRVVLTDLDGAVQAVIGTGRPGSEDGAFAEAAFRHPQGLAFDEGRLYIADTENHLIRRVDLAAGRVETVAGTGRQMHGPLRPDAGGPRATDLNSPWDLVVWQERLYVAMAGCHQIWALDLRGETLARVCGTGREALVDGPCLDAPMNQPSGLATDGTLLYVADSEASAIRTIDLRPGGWIRTLVGVGLFEFGDRDGSGELVRLQHPLGVAAQNGRVYIADTYNHKLKTLFPTLGRVETLAGTGRPGTEDGERPQFFEPGGLAATSGHLLVADTNNHRIRVFDLATERVTTLALRGL
jgi:sugar lactone lactonase YvrE